MNEAKKGPDVPDWSLRVRAQLVRVSHREVVGRTASCETRSEPARFFLDAY